MTKPIGFYTGHPIGQQGILYELEKKWGGRFENITENEKIWLLAQLARQYWFAMGSSIDIRDGVSNAAARIQEELTPSTQVKLMEGIINQLSLRDE